ncbi:MAG: YigZ family protein [Saprospiraceae bacterium]|nr:YigZ family protein [Saprospiraceae bacterium]
MKDTYLTLAAPSEGLFKDKGSKFLAYAYEVNSLGDVKKHLEILKKEHLKSRHHCYAYRIGMDGKVFRANDDGEPSGTAGRPILGQIDSFGLTNVFVVVVRYFGGVKLGTSGLKNAYKAAAREALDLAQKVERIIEDVYELSFDYAHTSDVMNYLKKEGFEILKSIYEEQTKLHIRVRQNAAKRFKENLEKIDSVELKLV